MAMALRVVCIVAAACGAAVAAPASSITYDQRQNGEMNVHVDLSDVAILLLPGDGGEFAQRSSLTDRVFQILGRRSGGHSKKKNKNKECSSTAATITTTTTKVPDVTSIAETSQGYEEVMATEYEMGADQKPAGDVQAENVVPAEETTSAAAAVTGNAVTAVEKTAVTAVEKTAVTAVEKTAVTAVEKTAVTGGSDDGVTAVVEQIAEEHDSGGDVIAMATETTKTDAEPAVGNQTGPGKTVSGEPAEMVPVKTLEKPVADAAAGPVEAVAEKETTSAAPPPLAAVGGGEPTEMVAMKTMEKPGGVSPADVSADAKPAREQGRPPHDADVVVASRSATKQTEMVAVKTVDSPATTTVITVKTATAVKTGSKANPATPVSSSPPSSSSNGSSIMRKVADRKPLPSITLDVASPKVALQ